MKETLEPVRVLGLGNVLMGDDALGPWVIETLQAGWEFPEGVSVLDVGTPGLDLTPFLADADTVILVDTVKANAPPGTLRVYSREQLASRAPSPRVSPHDPGLTEALFALDFVGAAPRDVILVGVVPASTERGVGLSPEVDAAVGRAAQEVVMLLSCLARTPRRRRDALRAAPWWERATDVRIEVTSGA
ncbi:MAG: hydrogenase maturation protease [Syntrophomonadaceae bacterium]